MAERTRPYAGLLHEVVAHAGVLYLSGLVADDFSCDITGQARDCLAQMKRLLETHGANLDHVLQVTIYFADWRTSQLSTRNGRQRLQLRSCRCRRAWVSVNSVLG